MAIVFVCAVCGGRLCFSAVGHCFVGCFIFFCLVCIDVSFVSLKKFSQKLFDDFESVEIVALIKPQFECGIDYAKKHKGIVKDEKVREKIVEDVSKNFENVGFKNMGIISSPILGGDGNIEYLIYLKKII